MPTHSTTISGISVQWQQETPLIRKRPRRRNFKESFHSIFSIKNNKVINNLIYKKSQKLYYVRIMKLNKDQ